MSGAPAISLVGATPLVRLHRLPPPGAQLWAKCEHWNLGGSMHDRVANAVITRLCASGVGAGATLVACHAGNLGLSLAVVGARRGYRCVLVVPSEISKKRLALLRAYRAEVLMAPPDEMRDVALTRAASPGGVFVDLGTDPAGHLGGVEIAREIVDALGPPAVVVVGVGTGQTARGVGAELADRAPGCRVVGVVRGPADDAADPLAGVIQGLSVAPDALPNISELRPVGARAAWQVARDLSRREGILAGHSSGGVVAVALALLAEGAQGPVAAILADSGERHFAVNERFRSVP